MRITRRRGVLGLGVAAFCVVSLVASPAPATIAEQRARLPPAAECADETVAGVWRSHAWSARWDEWQVFTLYVRRVPDRPGALVGRIENHFWAGGRDAEEPPPCAAQRGYDAVVSMRAEGSVSDDGTIRFGGVGQWTLERTNCGGMPGGYNLDVFSGQIDPTILEFQSVNNDGGRAVNEPTVFRRIRCPPTPSAEAPSVNPHPPRFYPEGGGCSWF
ncbi:MAG: hypothetical protein AB8I08_03270 [Sandaracinaceae bacterium]